MGATSFEKELQNVAKMNGSRYSGNSDDGSLARMRDRNHIRVNIEWNGNC